VSRKAEGFRAVVIGGGVAGCSIAYHLAERGCGTVLLERDELTSGSTFHSAGLVGQLRSSVTLTRMMMYSVDLYRKLETETGVSVGWREVGSLRLASSAERMEELQRIAGWARTFGLPLQLISTEEALALWPLFDPAGVRGAAYLPTDGHLDPSGLTLALAEGARRKGAEIRTGVRVTGIEVERGHVVGVTTSGGGRLGAEVVVNAGGMFANQLGHMAGVEIPTVPFGHQYLVTEPIEGVRADLPTMRDPDRLIYFREEVGGLVMGGYERSPSTWAARDGPPSDFNHQLLPEDWDRFEPLADAAFGLVPAMQGTGVKQLINGPEAFTPDGEFILGETEVRGLYVAAGFCAHGIAGAGGVGKIMAEWIVDGEPEWDVWKMDVSRFGSAYRSRDYAEVRAREIYSTYYDVRYPAEERQAGRPLKMSPAYPQLEELGAVFGEKAGWERANWFASNEEDAYEHLRPRGFAGQHWSTAIPAEHVACRERVALFDETSFAKILVEGPDAELLLQRVCANDVGGPERTIVYTQLLNPRGGIVCDLTATRLAANRYMLVTGTALGGHDRAWISRQIRDERAVVRDVTDEWVTFGLWGPRARDVLVSVCDEDLSEFPYMSARRIVIGGIACWALRVTYVGELGWELYAPTASGADLYSKLSAAGVPFGIAPGGYRAIDSLRLEKGYLAWGSDITPEETPLEAGLGFAVAWEKGGFIGREALERQRTEGVRRRMTCLVLSDPRAAPLGNEPIFVDGHVVSRVTSGGIGYTVGRSIALAYLPAELAGQGTRLEVEVFGERVGAEVARRPLWDPAGELVRA
jgi:glycine cleavage system T protein